MSDATPDSVHEPIELLGQVVRLAAPASMAERYVVVQLPHGELAQPIQIAIALGLCWPEVRDWLKRKQRIVWRGKPYEFGEAVFQWMTEHPKGLNYDAAGKAYIEALRVCGMGLPTLPSPDTAEGDELEGNFEPEEEVSTSTS